MTMKPTMQCEQFDRVIDDFIEGQLEPAEYGRVHAHLEHCPRCNENLAEHHSYLALMGDLPAPQAAPGRLAHMLRQARLAGESTRQQGSGRWAFLGGFATAAALALLLLAGQWPPGAPLQQADPAKKLAAIAEHALRRQVTVVINVPADMPDADLALDFPAALRLEGLEDLHHVAWSVDLKKGANVLTLPLTIAAGTDLAATQTIEATVRYEDREKDFDLPVDLLVEESPLQGTLFTRDEASIYHI